MRSLAIAVFFISSTTFACPNLAGTYATCVSQTGNTAGSTNMVITQSSAGNVTTYTVSSIDAESHTRQTEVLKADGKTVSVTTADPESGMRIKFDTTIRCNGTKYLGIDMLISMNGEQASSMKMQISKSGKTLTMINHMKSPEGAATETIICD